MMTLENGIELPAEWPPRDVEFASSQPQRVPWLERPPAVIGIDRGRQLLVDDFLVDPAFTSMVRVFHQPVKYPGNPILFPQTPDELGGENYPPCAVAKCGGVWFDAADRLFKMWYMTGYVGFMAYAVSRDGVHWERPELDVVPGTNLCLPRDRHPDSGSVIIDYEAADPAARFKMLMRGPNLPKQGRLPGLLLVSGDGVHWTEIGKTGPMDDRSTMYRDPFRKKWVQSIRAWQTGPRRCRLFFEADDFLASGQWQAGEPVAWTRADSHDTGEDAYPELYNLDAIAYESLLIGFHQILKGPPNQIGDACGLPKLTELTLGYSRDGFHWHRPDRRSFIGARREPGSWEYGYVESSAGMCHIVGDELWFYYSAYAGEPGRPGHGFQSGMYANGAVGLAKLRRDGFASMQARFAGAAVQTRPVRFSGSHLFINVATAGSTLKAAVLDEAGQVIDGFAEADCLPFNGNSTAVEIGWRGGKLETLRGRPVRFRFTMDRGDLYAFWVAKDARGHSDGYTGAGGPGIGAPTDRHAAVDDG